MKLLFAENYKMASGDVTVNPANLIGKLHQAAVEKVEDKWGGKIEIVNTAINVSGKDGPAGVMNNGDYKIICRILDKDAFKSKDAIRQPVVEYLTLFAGPDVADKFKASKSFNKKVSSFLSGESNEFEIPYGMVLRGGRKVSDEEAVRQQAKPHDGHSKADTKDDNVIDVDAEVKDVEKSGSEEPKTSKRVSDEIMTSLADAGDVRESNPVVDASKDASKLKDEGFAKKVIDSISDMADGSGKMDEGKMLLIMGALKNFKDIYKEEDVEVEEDENGPGTAETIYDKYEKYFNASMTAFSNTAKKSSFKLRDFAKRLSGARGKTFLGKLWRRLNISSDITREFRKDVYRWAENAAKKAKESFGTYFVRKKASDRRDEKRADTEKAKERLAKRDAKSRIDGLRDEVKKLKKFFAGSGNGELELVEKPIKEVEWSARGRGAWTIGEILKKAGPITLERFLHLARGEYYNPRKEKNEKNPQPLVDFVKKNRAAAKEAFKNFPKEIFGWIPSEVADALRIDGNSNFLGKVEESKGFLVKFDDVPGRQFLLESKTGPAKTNLDILTEHRKQMRKLSEKLVHEVMAGHNTKAQDILKSIIRKKTDKRIKDVLEDEKVD